MDGFVTSLTLLTSWNGRSGFGVWKRKLQQRKLDSPEFKRTSLWNTNKNLFILKSYVAGKKHLLDQYFGHAINFTLAPLAIIKTWIWVQTFLKIFSDWIRLPPASTGAELGNALYTRAIKKIGILSPRGDTYWVLMGHECTFKSIEQRYFE